MDFSKFKFELYDILALVLPGFLQLCSVWVLLRGWHNFALSLVGLTGTGFTALLLASFALGHVIQELGDAAIKRLMGDRFFRRGRDEFWKTDEGKNIGSIISREIGFKTSVDGAFDFCLTKINGRFPRRDSFLATSDFCRSLLIVGFLVVPSLIRVLMDGRGTRTDTAFYSIVIVLVLALALFLYLAGRRMLRFRELSEVTVFRTYLACLEQRSGPEESC